MTRTLTNCIDITLSLGCVCAKFHFLFIAFYFATVINNWQKKKKKTKKHKKNIVPHRVFVCVSG